MRNAWITAVLMTGWMTGACYAEFVPAGPAAPSSPAPVNSIAFARLPPLPGQLSYLDTILYIDSRIRYIDPAGQFLVSPTGEVCFRTRPTSPMPIYDHYYRLWCMYPQLVGRVEAMTNAVTNINGVRLWCGHDFPQCAYSVGEIGWSANDVYVQSIDNRQVQAALANLIHMMGGGAAVAEPLSLRVTERLR